MKTSIHVAWITGCIYVAAMVHLAKGAENPCEKVWQWQWKTPPTLSIEAPQDVPDQCLGVITIGSAVVTATAGVKWEVDINNCPEPPHTRNETTVPITPVNTWEIYTSPVGTTPPSGSGTSATLTNIHAGTLVVQFKSEASVANPPWDDAVGNMTNPFGVGPEIIHPDGDPVTDNHYTFSYTSGEPWPDGRCDIFPEAILGGSAEKWLEWSYPDISGCLKSVNNGQSPYLEPVLSYLQLPVANAYFGEKTVTVTRKPDNCEHEVIVELFFSAEDDAVNHPGSQSGVTPNWYYYWNQTPAKYSFNPAIYDANRVPAGNYGITLYVGGQWRPYIGPGGNDSFTPPVGDNAGTNLHGIDFYAYLSRHEARHATIMNFWYPDGNHPDPDRDSDTVGAPAGGPPGDLLLDSAEPALGGTWENPQNGGPFVVGDYDTNINGQFDGHDYIYHTQSKWTKGSADASDWSSPGHQFDQ